MSSPAALMKDLTPGSATPQGTLRYAARFQGISASGHFREISSGLVLSSLGVGTYLGEPDRTFDEGYTASIVAAVEGGINVVDSAINYRFQRSERSAGAALAKLRSNGFARDEIVLCTKAGFLTPDGSMPEDPNAYFAREFLERGIFRSEEIAAGCHCMAPGYLADQLDRSRRNLGVQCVDVFYVHNPETQLTEVSADVFAQRLRAAFTFLESAAREGKIGAYGLATWNAFREDPNSAGYLSLEAMVGIAREIAGESHHLRFVQLPFNLAMPEALTRHNQVVDGKPMPMVQAARALGITLITSAALLQGQLTKNLPPFVRSALLLPTDSALALQFARSVPGLTTALVGMSKPAHAKMNLELVHVEPAPREQFLKLFEPKK
ncbi:MAG TPA: aldo/keto reductase [Candidatus Limnocylindrales bacterium]|jgi:aryl-alcohol dehydrogenase-like predicted oxidoreductase|nr:aldo/keto reductase [Candidatus Limnocylindrales bacterium]